MEKRLQFFRKMGVVLLCVAACALGVFATLRYLPSREPKSVADTVWLTRVDTIRLTHPVERLRTIVRVDTVWLAMTDTTARNDSVRVALPIEHRLYTDDSIYRASVSGYGARLDSLVFLRPVRQQTITRSQQARFVLTIGAQAGYYRTPCGWQPGVGVGVGAGVTIKFGNGTRRRKSGSWISE